MQVTFTKVAGNRYTVAIEREHGPALVPRFAPGYDDLMPHDLAHYLVEEHFQIELGVFGQLAAGGRGIFTPAPDDDGVRYRRTAQRISTVGHDDMVRSERLVILAVSEWERSIGRPKHHALIWNVEVDPEELQTAIVRLNEVASRWQALQSGSSLTFTWPRQLTFEASKSRRGRRQPQRKSSGHATARTVPGPYPCWRED